MDRPKFSYTIPEKARQFVTDPKEFTFVPITAREEKDANDAAEGSKTPLAYELVKRSCVALNGKPIDWNTSDADWLDKASPKVRQLAFEAFARVNRPAKEDADAFLASEKVTS